jgi:hypothetical protein
MPVPLQLRRICSYDMVEVPADCYTVADEGGEMLFCGPRCLCIWSVQFATNPNRSEEQKNIALEMTSPDGSRRRFTSVTQFAQWAAANALGGVGNVWLRNGKGLNPAK